MARSMIRRAYVAARHACVKRKKAARLRKRVNDLGFIKTFFDVDEKLHEWDNTSLPRTKQETAAHEKISREFNRKRRQLAALKR